MPFRTQLAKITLGTLGSVLRKAEINLFGVISFWSTQQGLHLLNGLFDIALDTIEI